MKRILLAISIALAITAGLLAGLGGARDALASPSPKPMVATDTLPFEGVFTGSWYNTGHNVSDGPYTATSGHEASVWGTFDSSSGKIKNPEFGWTMTTPSEEIYTVTVCGDRWGTPWDGEPADQGTIWEPATASCSPDGSNFSSGGMNCQTYECDSYIEFNAIRFSGELHCDGDPPQECGWDVWVGRDGYEPCTPVTDTGLYLLDGFYVPGSSEEEIYAFDNEALSFQVDYLPASATTPVPEEVVASGGATVTFNSGSPDGYWAIDWPSIGDYIITYSVANCDATGNLGDTSIAPYPGHQWATATVHVEAGCVPITDTWLSPQAEYESSGGEIFVEPGTFFGFAIETAPDYASLPISKTATAENPIYWEQGLRWTSWPSTGRKIITVAAANCDGTADFGDTTVEPYPGHQWATATVVVTTTTPITYLIPITQPTAPTMDCTYCLRPAEVCTESSSICIIPQWIEWQTCLQRCWFDFGLDWSIYVFQLFQWWSVELVNFHYAWLRYFWMSAMYQYEEIYSKWSAIQTLVSAYYHNYASFIQSLSVWINISSINIISSFDEIAAFLAGKIAQMAPLISAWSTEVSDWINAVKDALTAWSFDTFDKLGRFLKNFVLFLRIIYLFIRMSTASGLEKLRIAWKLAKLSAQLMSSRLLGPFRSVIGSIRQMAELAGDLGAGAKAAINSDTKANLFSFGSNFSEYNAAHQLDGMEMQAAEGEGGLSYTLEGLEFFEELAGTSPLNFASYIAIGVLALRLSMWTLAKTRDLMEDLRHF